MIELRGTKLYDTKEMAIILGVTVDTISRYHKKGLQVTRVICVKNYYSEDALREFVRSRF